MLNLYFKKEANGETLEVFAADGDTLWTIVVAWKTTIAGEKVLYCESRGNIVSADNERHFYGWSAQFCYTLQALLEKIAAARGYNDDYIEMAYQQWLRHVTDEDFTLRKWIDTEAVMAQKAKEEEENNTETERGCIGF
ncbi:MAG: hypothetical protein IJG83_09470 [Thermoguttaceae bacterium]|nr:hypothetical protein [Thermoguttaceae bacterium]